jgi:uncharacterized protein (DUF2267 family)
MKYDSFVGQVQSRGGLASLGDAVGAIRATLETLGERLAGGEAKDLASQLPREIGYYLFRGSAGFGGERFDYNEFVERVAYRACVDRPKAAYLSRVVMELVNEAVSPGEFEDVVQQLPADFSPLFAGSRGNVRKGTWREQSWPLANEGEIEPVAENRATRGSTRERPSAPRSQRENQERGIS